MKRWIFCSSVVILTLGFILMAFPYASADPLQEDHQNPHPAPHSFFDPRLLIIPRSFDGYQWLQPLRVAQLQQQVLQLEEKIRTLSAGKQSVQAQTEITEAKETLEDLKQQEKNVREGRPFPEARIIFL